MKWIRKLINKLHVWKKQCTPVKVKLSGKGDIDWPELKGDNNIKVDRKH